MFPNGKPAPACQSCGTALPDHQTWCVKSPDAEVPNYGTLNLNGKTYKIVDYDWRDRVEDTTCYEIWVERDLDKEDD